MWEWNGGSSTGDGKTERMNGEGKEEGSGMGSDMGATDEATMFSLIYATGRVYGIVTEPSDCGERPRGIDTVVRLQQEVCWPISPP